MNPVSIPHFRSIAFRAVASLFGAAVLSTAAAGAGASGALDRALLDDCADARLNSCGAERLLIDDKALGSQSQATQSCADGVLTVKGSLAPGRGVPAFMSLVLLVSPDGQPRDLSAFEGVRLRLRVRSGTISVQACSTGIDNFDYHASQVPARGGEFQEVRLAFAGMKRAWSAPTPLDLKSITSINLVAFAMAKGEFAYEIDEIGFY